MQEEVMREKTGRPETRKLAAETISYIREEKRIQHLAEDAGGNDVESEEDDIESDTPLLS